MPWAKDVHTKVKVTIDEREIEVIAYADVTPARPPTHQEPPEAAMAFIYEVAPYDPKDNKFFNEHYKYGKLSDEDVERIKEACIKAS
jgi:hypothetical protein